MDGIETYNSGHPLRQNNDGPPWPVFPSGQGRGSVDGCGRRPSARPRVRVLVVRDRVHRAGTPVSGRLAPPGSHRSLTGQPSPISRGATSAAARAGIAADSGREPSLRLAAPLPLARHRAVVPDAREADRSPNGRRRHQPHRSQSAGQRGERKVELGATPTTLTIWSRRPALLQREGCPHRVAAGQTRRVTRPSGPSCSG
jgi:hypothetical protein